MIDIFGWLGVFLAYFGYMTFTVTFISLMEFHVFNTIASLVIAYWSVKKRVWPQLIANIMWTATAVWGIAGLQGWI